MSTRGRGRGGRGTTSQGVTTTSVLTPAVPSMPNNPEHNSSVAPHISESVQASESLTLETKDQSMENGSVPLTDEELSCVVLGPKPGYIRGLGHGPKPSLTKSGQASRAQLIRDAEEAREAAAAAERKCDEALAEAAQTRKNTEQLSETMANMQSQINLLLQLNGRNMPSNDANCSTNYGDLLGDEDAMEC